MAIDKTWKILTLNSETDTGGVVYASARYEVSETIDNELIVKGRNIGAVFSPKAENVDFINFEDLSETDVLQWVWDYIGNDKKERIENTIDSKFLDKKTRIQNEKTLSDEKPSDW